MDPNLGDRESPLRERWTKIGYLVTAAWMVFVLVRTDGNPDDPLFNFLFVVPLVGWVVAVVAVKMIAAFRGRR